MNRKLKEKGVAKEAVEIINGITTNIVTEGGSRWSVVLVGFATCLPAHRSS